MKVTKDCESLKVDATMHNQFVGSLIYLIHSRLNLAFNISFVSKFMHDPKESPWKVATRIGVYVKDMYSLSVKYFDQHSTQWSSYTNFDWASDEDD